MRWLHLSHGKNCTAKSLRLLFSSGGLLVCVLAVAGCAHPSTQPDGSNAETEKHFTSGNDHSTSRKNSTVRILHDFGIVRPESRSIHRFRIQNSGGSPWTVDSVARTCRCTTTRLSSEIVEPGGDLLVDVRYTAPPEDGRDERTVEVHFRESDAPVFILGARALVRHPLYLTDKELKIETDEDVGIVTLVAANFTDRTWAGLNVSSGAPWLTADLVPVEDERVGASRQAWRVTVTADMRTLPSGDDLALLTFVPDGVAKEESQQATVRVVRRPAVRPVPSQVFLGTVSCGQQVKRRVILHLSEHAIREHGRIVADNVVVTSAFDGKIAHIVHPLHQKIVALDLTVVAPESPAVIAETISIDLGASWPKIELPLAALVEASP